MLLAGKFCLQEASVRVHITQEESSNFIPQIVGSAAVSMARLLIFSIMGSSPPSISFWRARVARFEGGGRMPFLKILDAISGV